MKNAVVVDVDGTLGSSEWRRRAFLYHPEKDWDGFHKALERDTPNTATIAMLHRAREEGNWIIVLTMRPEKWRGVTVAWLQTHGIPYDELLMKPPTDWRKGHVVKRDVLRDLKKQHHILYVLDDDAMVLHEVEQLGLRGVKITDPDLEPA